MLITLKAEVKWR